MKLKSVLKIRLLLILSVFNLLGNAQEIFRTKDGDVVINSTFNGERFRGESKQLSAVINYETAEIQLRLDPSTIRTKADTFNVCFKSADAEKLNECIQKSELPIATLIGNLNLPYINTGQYPDYELKFEAKFQLNGVTKPVIVLGELNHINSNDLICCLLTLNFNFNLKDHGVTPPDGFAEIAYVHVFQVVLKKDNP